MTVVNPKSISGINSITMASGSDNLLTIHTTNTTERVRVNSDGDVIVGSGITVSPDGDIFATGVCTATSFIGNGSGLTNLSTDLVNDTSPQLGGTLDANGNSIAIDDGDAVRFGASNDLEIYHSSNISTIKDSYGDLRIMSDSIRLQRAAGGENYLYGVEGGKVSLYYDGSEKFETSNTGNQGTGILKLISGNGSTASDDNILHIVSGGTADRGLMVGTGRATGASQNDGMVFYDAINSESNEYGSQHIFRRGGHNNMVIGYQSNNYVGINNDYPDYELSVKATDANESTIQILAGGNGKESNLLFGAPDDADVGAIKYDHNGDQMKFIVGTSEIFRANSNGICLGGTGSANGLDDYEEGTWSPSGSWTTITASYTKVGRMVYAGFSLRANASSGNVTIGNLPFTSGSTHAHGGGIAWGLCEFNSSGGMLNGSPGDNSTSVSVRKNNAEQLTFGSGQNAMNNSAFIRGVIIYMTA